MFLVTFGSIDERRGVEVAIVMFDKLSDLTVHSVLGILLIRELLVESWRTGISPIARGYPRDENRCSTWRLMNTLFFRFRFTCLITLVTLLVAAQAAAQDNDGVKIHEQRDTAIQRSSSNNLKVVLLGTGVGPPVNLQQYGASTLIEAGDVRLLFDCGRGATLRLTQVGVPIGSISR